MSKDRRKVRTGRVVSDKMDKTVVVAVQWSQRNRLYGKPMRRITKFYAHDATNDCSLGDMVRIEETRPISRLKNWRVIDVIERREVAEVRPMDLDREFMQSQMRGQDAQAEAEIQEEAVVSVADEQVDLDEASLAQAEAIALEQALAEMVGPEEFEETETLEADDDTTSETEEPSALDAELDFLEEEEPTTVDAEIDPPTAETEEPTAPMSDEDTIADAQEPAAMESEDDATSAEAEEPASSESEDDTPAATAEQTPAEAEADAPVEAEEPTDLVVEEEAPPTEDEEESDSPQEEKQS